MRTKAMWKLTWPEVKKLIDEGGGVILPIGAIEQHGPHLPLDTDVVLPTELSLALAKETNMLVASPITYATNSRPLSGGGQTFIGTTSISAITFMNLIEEVIEEFIRHGFKKILLFNWHGENGAFIYEAAFNAMKNVDDQNVKVIVMDKPPLNYLSDETMDQLYPEGFPGWNLEHAAILETSLMLYLDSDSVLFDRAVDDTPPEVQPYDILPIPDKFIAQSGCLWKGTQATAEKGRLCWEDIKSGLLDTIEREFQ